MPVGYRGSSHGNGRFFPGPGEDEDRGGPAAERAPPAFMYAQNSSTAWPKTETGDARQRCGDDRSWCPALASKQNAPSMLCEPSPSIAAKARFADWTTLLDLFADISSRPAWSGTQTWDTS